MTTGLPVATGADPVVTLLVATAVGFVEAGLGSHATARLRELAGGDLDALRRALGWMDEWEHVSRESRLAARRMLVRAARAPALPSS